MLNLDETERDILSITEDTEIAITVRGKTDIYHPVNEYGNWEMKATDKDNVIYGLSCDSIKELRAALLMDYATGIITNAEIKNIPLISSITPSR